VKPGVRIPALLRELADEFDALLAEEPKVPGVTVERLPSGRFRALVRFGSARVGGGTHASRSEALGCGVATLDILRERGLRARRQNVPRGPGVYAIACGKLVKVGRARSIRRRMKELQGSQPLPLRFIAHLSTNPDDEGAWHERLSAFRVRGEWFRLCDEVLALFQGASA
jgi:hypothetical protein